MYSSILTLLMVMFVSFCTYGQQTILYCDFNGNEIRRTVMGTSIDDPVTSTGNQPRNIILDQSNNNLYWIENQQDVFTMKIDGTGKQEVPINASQDIGDLTLDEERAILYFSEFFTGNINAYNLQSQEVTTIITNAQQGSIAFSKPENALYYSDGTTGKIVRYDLNTQQTADFPGEFPVVNDIAVDPLNEQVYFSEFNSRKVYRSNFDGTGLLTLQEGLGINGLLYVKPEAGIYFWSDNLAPGFVPAIYQSNMSSNTTESVFEYGPNSIGGFVVLGETTTQITERESLNATCFPNPASEKLTIDLGRKMNVEAIEIYTTNGQLVDQQNVNTVSGGLQVSLNKLNSGMHILKVTGSEILEPIPFQVFR